MFKRKGITGFVAPSYVVLLQIKQAIIDKKVHYFNAAFLSTILFFSSSALMAADYTFYNNFGEIWQLDVYDEDRDAIYLNGPVTDPDGDGFGIAILSKIRRTASFTMLDGDFIDAINFNRNFSSGKGVSYGFGEEPEVAIYSSSPLEVKLQELRLKD